MRDRPTHSYTLDPDDITVLERFDIAPVDPDAVDARVDAGEVLHTVDVPEYLSRSLVVEAGTDTALYRLVQLFGTPNVAGLEAGADQPDRERTTWQYLFDVTFEPEDGTTETYLLSIYDYKTDVSVGLSTWSASEEDSGRVAREPADGTTFPGDVPDEEILVALVQLVLNVVDEPVPATYKDLWV